MATSAVQVRWKLKLAELIAWQTCRQLESEQQHELRFPASILHLIFIQYVSGETDIARPMLLSQVSSYWRQAAHNLRALWSTVHIKPSKFYSTLSLSIQDFDILLDPLPKIFSAVDVHITLPLGIPRSGPDLISDCENENVGLRGLNITATSTEWVDNLISSWRLRSCASLQTLAIHNNAPKHDFHLIMHDVAFSKSLQTLELFEIDGITMPALPRLKVLVISGSKKRIPAEEVAVFLSELPRLRRLEVHATPILLNLHTPWNTFPP